MSNGIRCSKCGYTETDHAEIAEGPCEFWQPLNTMTIPATPAPEGEAVCICKPGFWDEACKRCNPARVKRVHIGTVHIDRSTGEVVDPPPAQSHSQGTTDTPETDANARHTIAFGLDCEIIDADFARALGRRLSALQRENEGLREELITEAEHLEQMTLAANQLHAELRESKEQLDGVAFERDAYFADVLKCRAMVMTTEDPSAMVSRLTGELKEAREIAQKYEDRYFSAATELKEAKRLLEERTLTNEKSILETVLFAAECERKMQARALRSDLATKDAQIAASVPLSTYDDLLAKHSTALAELSALREAGCAGSEYTHLRNVEQLQAECEGLKKERDATLRAGMEAHEIALARAEAAEEGWEIALKLAEIRLRKKRDAALALVEPAFREGYGCGYRSATRDGEPYSEDSDWLESDTRKAIALPVAGSEGGEK